MKMINPHGGQLVNKILSEAEGQKIIDNVGKYQKIILDEEQLKDVCNIATGIYSPLEGFLREADMKRVVSDMRLLDGNIWPIPIVLDIDNKSNEQIKDQKEILLLDSEENIIAILKNIELYNFDKDFFCRKCIWDKR